MPIEDYGQVMRSAAWAPASVPNAFQQGREDAQRNALFDYKFKQQQQEDADHAAWVAAINEGRQTGDFSKAFQIDPETTTAFAKSQLDYQKAQQPPAPIEETTLPSGRVLAVQGGNPVGSPWAPEKAAAIQEQPGPFGSRIVTDGNRWQVVEPPKPQGSGAAKPGYGAPEKGTNPQTGKPDMFVIDDMGNAKWLGIEPPAPQQALSPKDTSAALQKRNQIRLARQQLALARQKYGAIQNTFSAGPGGKFVPTPAGKAFDASIDSMRNTITAITRVPGVGAMSDYETRLAQAQFPERGNYEAVTSQQLQSIEDMLNALDQGYSDLLGGTQSQAPAAPKERPPLESFKRK